MRKSICFMMISVSLFAALLSLRVQAASGDGLRLDEGGTVTVVSQHAAKEGISSLCFSLSVESANGASVEFQFGDSKAKILDYRYDAAAGNLKVYLAGTEALFAEGTDALTVGKIKVLDGGGNEVTATVSAVENSLQYVYGTEVKTMLEVELPEAVQIGPAPVQPPPSQPENPSTPENPSPPQNPSTPQTPAATQAPAVLPPQLPVVLPTPRPVQRPRATASPRPTEAPAEDSAESTQPPETESQPSEESVSDVSPSEENLPTPSPSPDVEDENQADKEEKEVNLFMVIAVIAVLVVVVIEVMAFVVLKKPGRPGRRRRG
ncbi:MAG: hypothetical protein HFH81_04710 [Lachnospiraceae bacterium]|nr:hypothetical protein [Lachnospiraceae bacterium]